MTSGSSNKDSDKAARVPDPRARFRPRTIWEYDWETEDVRELPPTPLGIAWYGILLAAGCFPSVLSGVLMLADGWQRLSALEVVATFIFMVVYMMLSFVVGLIYGIIMSIPAFFLARLLSLSLKGIVSERGGSGIFGGMTGFLCISWGGLLAAQGMLSNLNWTDWVCYIFALVLSIVMGHVGAIVAGYRRRNDAFPFFEPIFSFEKRITIGYLMKLTLIVAVFAVILKAAGPVGLYIGITWMAYLLVQTLLLIGDHWLTAWLSHR